MMDESFFFVIHKQTHKKGSFILFLNAKWI